METENLLIELLKIPSSSGNERKLAEFIAKKLKKNFSVKIQRFNGSANVLAIKGKPKVLFNAHLDTVPKQLKIIKKGKFIYGRGACDTKSQIAAMIISAEKLKDIALLFDSCEEKDFSGIKKALPLIPKSVKRIIVGEPTNSDLVIGQKGLLTLKILCTGKKAHGSMPEKGVNAIDKLIGALETLKKQNLGYNKLFGKAAMNLGKISGGITSNVVPDYAEALVDIRTVSSSRKLYEKLKRKLDVKLMIINSFDPILTDIKTKLKLKKRTVPYFTEAYFLDKKAKVLIIGAGKEEDAHSDNEKVSMEEVKKIVGIYIALAKEV